jgi:FkbM family methyltransferase
MRLLKRAIQGTLEALGLHVVRLDRLMLLMTLGAEPEVRTGADPLERHMLERCLSEVLHRLDVNCVLDVGANQGQYGRLLRDIGYTGHIVSFEPVGEVFEQLHDAASHDPKWATHRLALGSERTSASMHVTLGRDFSSFLEPTAFSIRRFRTSAPVARDEQVDVRRLDEVWDAVIGHVERPRVFLKMDTQGYDLRVFEGARGVIDRILGMQSELSAVPLYEGVPSMLEGLRVYQASGFQLSGLFPVSHDPETSRVLEYDSLLVRSGS